jgi:hypothetical protein
MKSRIVAIAVGISLGILSGSGRAAEKQEPARPATGCSFSVSGRLVVRSDSDRDTLGFTGATFKLKIEAADDVTPTIETRTLFDRVYQHEREYKVVTFDLTSPTALVWELSGSPFDGTYTAVQRQ